MPRAQMLSFSRRFLPNYSAVSSKWEEFKHLNTLGGLLLRWLSPGLGLHWNIWLHRSRGLVPCVWKSETQLHSREEGDDPPLLPAPQQSQAMRAAGMTSGRMWESSGHSWLVRTAEKGVDKEDRIDKRTNHGEGRQFPWLQVLSTVPWYWKVS